MTRPLPPGTRLILASENLLDQFGTRTERGERITAEWGEPTPYGWYEPVFTVHSDDVLCAPDPADLARWLQDWAESQPAITIRRGVEPQVAWRALADELLRRWGR